MIQFHKVKKQYNKNDFVLGEIDFHIQEGEFVFLIGPSGSGKTSIIKLLIREEEPTNGKIYFNDYDITRLTRSSVYKLRRYIGVVFQDYKLIPDKTVFENVAFAMEVAGRSNREIKETVPYLLDIVGLSHRADAFPSFLSGGEKQRVAIARAVSNNPKVLVADEPTGNLDPAAAWDIVQILSKINNWGTTVIMSTHGTDIVNTLNKRVIQMDSGRVVRDDKKGLYEVASKISVENGSLEIPEMDLDDLRTGPIRVRIKPASDEEEKRGLLSRLWPFKKKESEFITPLEQEFGQKVDRDLATQEFVKDVDETLQSVSDEEVEQVLEDADKTSVTKLKLRKEIIADLITAGYNDVEDVISAGPEALADELIIDPEEVVLVARALTEFIDEEDQKLHQDVVNKEKIVEREVEEPESGSVDDSEEATPSRKRISTSNLFEKKNKKSEKKDDTEEMEMDEKKPEEKKDKKPKAKKSEVKIDLTSKPKSKKKK